MNGGPVMSTQIYCDVLFWKNKTFSHSQFVQKEARLCTAQVKYFISLV